MREKRNLIHLVLVLILTIGMAVPTFAAPKQEKTAQRLVDQADILTDEEEKTLLEKLNTISKAQKCDVIVATVKSFDGEKPTDYGKAFFGNNNYGQGKKKDGILFIISMGDRKWAVITHGFAFTAFTDAGQEYITDRVKPYLSDGEYADGFDKFADYCDQFLTQAKEDRPYDNSNLPDDGNPMLALIIAVVLGLIVSYIVTKIWAEADLTSVQEEMAAKAYVTKKEITNKKDIFLYSQVSQTKKPDDNDSDGGSSSIGDDYGGSSGDF